METSMPVVPYGFGNNNNGDSFGGMGGIGGILIGSLLGGRGGLFGNGIGNGGGGYGGGWGGGSPASSAVASEIVLSPTLNAIQGQINTLSGQVNNNALNDSITDGFNHIDDKVTSGFSGVQNSLANLSTAQASGNFLTLQSINGLGRDITASNTQSLIQNLNSFSVIGTAMQTGFNNQGMQIATATNQIIAGQTAISSDLANCCCEIKEKISSDGNMTRALLTANRMEDLTTELNEARLQASQAAQTNSLLSALRVVPVV